MINSATPRTTLAAALMCSAMPFAAQALVTDYDWRVSYTTLDAPLTTNVMRVRLSVDSDAADDCTDVFFPTADGQVVNTCGSFVPSSVVIDYLAGPYIGDDITVESAIVSSSKTAITHEGETTENSSYRFAFGKAESGDEGNVLQLLSLNFVPTGPFNANLVPVFDVSEFVGGSGYGIGGFQDDIRNVTLEDYVPPVPLPATGALLAMAAGGVALRSAAKARRAKARAARKGTSA